jgi:hypothetical protein
MNGGPLKPDFGLSGAVCVDLFRPHNPVIPAGAAQRESADLSNGRICLLRSLVSLAWSAEAICFCLNLEFHAKIAE